MRIRHVAAAVWVIVGLAGAASAKTVELTAQSCDRMAAICEAAPRLGCAMTLASTGVFTTTRLDLVLSKAFLIRYPLDQIPRGQRITHAEWVVPATYFSPVDARFFVWRLLPEWGPGACYLYRLARPEKLKWVMPGARGSSSDRSIRPSAIVRVTAVGEQVVNVTEDVELWYTGAAPNNGWMLTVEDPGTLFYFSSPVYDGAAAWKLRITYEPE